ncbi:MAG: hypothetical protein GX591_01130 [Planctomycetes bacterium]|nr:hypothetical protein [Planctomycetota bacterium]
MAKRQIQVGRVYSAKVGGSFLPVRIDASLGHGRYEGVCLPDGRTVKVTSKDIRGDGESVEQWEARSRPQEPEAPAEAPAAAPTAKRRKTKVASGATEATQRKPSGLDAAVTVLAEAGVPMTTGDIVKRMLETGLWQTGGKTPSATIYSAIIREIAVKGDASRFRKTDRGHFELTAAGREAR